MVNVTAVQTCQEIFLRKINLEYENGKQLQVTLIKITESKENKSTHRHDFSGSAGPWGSCPLVPPPPPALSVFSFLYPYFLFSSFPVLVHLPFFHSISILSCLVFFFFLLSLPFFLSFFLMMVFLSPGCLVSLLRVVLFLLPVCIRMLPVCCSYVLVFD